MSPPRTQTWTLEVPSNFTWMKMNVKPDGRVENLRLDHQTHAFAANSKRPCMHKGSHTMHQETWEFPVTLQCLKILTLLAKQHVPTLTDAWNGLGIELCRPRLFEVRLLQRARMEYFELQSTVQKHCNKKTPTWQPSCARFRSKEVYSDLYGCTWYAFTSYPSKLDQSGRKWRIFCNECRPYKHQNDYKQIVTFSKNQKLVEKLV